MDPVADTGFEVVPMTLEHAAAICTWRYPEPYDCYDLDVQPSELLRRDLGFHAVLQGARLIGFRSFGPDGRVPGWEYDDSALDTGGGLRPDLTGRGMGRRVIAAGLAFGRSRYAPPAFRITVAAFNVRALRVVESLGFERIGEFDGALDGRRFVVLVRPET